MKNFSIAFLVFLGWCAIGFYFLKASDALNRRSIFSNYLPPSQNSGVNFNQLDSLESQKTLIKQELEDSNINSFVESNLARGNEQLIETLSKSIEAKTRAIEKDKERLREAKLNAESRKKNTVPRRVDYTFYPEFSIGGRVVDDYSSQEFLDYIKIRLEKKPNAKIKIIGYTDYVGSDIDNYKVAFKEAIQVRNYILVRLKIPENQVFAYSKGENDPIVLNTNESERKKNNRIEVIIE
ncbi:OmpA family protein [Leeuwenhoekiella sp. MAR_2009_132]|uniref:OmpA family protein n=1 Tax=Leeuwenhoekiella sp. MAR_2009_132 TaxID=1392489 RepID=UPI00048C56DD|nr:OmpA family protein [Leeuwenhoekiella sp. MAR_2009_132]